MTVTEPASDAVSCDLLVIGGGIAGMSAAAHAASGGLNVIVVERSDHLGGSSVLSGGKVWTPKSVDEVARLDPAADLQALRMLVGGIGEVVNWMTSLGAEVSEPRPFDGLLGYPTIVRDADIGGFVAKCQRLVERCGGWIALETSLEDLLIERGAVVGAKVQDRDGRQELRARFTVLATGGFQGSTVLRRRYMHPGADRLAVRSNPCSRGDGLRLALKAGAAIRSNDRFYGHLVPVLDHPIESADFRRFSQLYSTLCILVSPSGDRFADESLSYYGNAFEVSRLPEQRAVMIGDSTVCDDSRPEFGSPGTQVTDAAKAGARVAHAKSPRELDMVAQSWGYTGAGQAVVTFNELMETETAGSHPARVKNRRPLDVTSLFAMEVEPMITFPFGGLRAGTDGRVIDQDNRPIGGLLAAGVDVATYNEVYGGGLAFGLVSGIAAARTAAAEPTTA